MKFNRLLPLLLLLLLSMTMAFAGSLVSVSTVDVKSNYENIDGEALVVSWISTPFANDYLTINNAILPDGYTIEREVDVDVGQPEFEQEFKVFNAIPVNKVSYQNERFFYFNIPGAGKSAKELCNEDVDNYVAENHPGKDYLPGTGWIGYVGGGSCSVEFVLVDKQLGWVGELTHTGWDYEQDINVEGLGTLTLESNQKATQLSDSIGTTATARLLNFGSWFNAPLTDNNVFAFHGKTTQEGDWNPIYLNDQYSSYNEVKRQLVNHFNNIKTINTDIRTFVNNHNSIANEISFANSPRSWENAELSGVSRSGNQMSVPINQDVLTSNIQLILKGESIGLVVPVGEPRILSVESDVTLKETESTLIEYQVENAGKERGSFFLQVFCGDEIGSQRLTVQLNSGERDKGTISLTAKSSELAGDIDKTCKLRMTESTTNKYDEESFDITIEQKANCRAGEQSAPYLSEDEQNNVVNVLNEKCEVVDVITCPVTQRFIVEKGSYKCVDAPINGGTSGGNKTFNPTILIITAILSLIGFVLVYVPTSALNYVRVNDYPVGLIIRIVLSLVVAGLIFWIVPGMISAVIDKFSFFI
jgi:hypothetical protein